MINFMSNQVPSQRSIMSTNGGRSIVVIKQENISMQNSDHSHTVSTCPTYSWLISVITSSMGKTLTMAPRLPQNRIQAIRVFPLSKRNGIRLTSATDENYPGSLMKKYHI